MATPEIKIGTYTHPVTENEFTATVKALAEADAQFKADGTDAQASAEITAPKAEANKQAVKFAKAANQAGHGARKRSTTENEDGTITLVYTLGKIRDLSKSKAETVEETPVEVAETPAESAKLVKAATGK